MCVFSHLVVSDSLQPHDCSPPGSSVHGTSQARILEWLAISFFRGSSQPRDRTWISCVSCIADVLFTHWAIGEASEPLGNCEGNDNLGSLWDTLRVYRDGRGRWRGEREHSLIYSSALNPISQPHQSRATASCIKAVTPRSLPGLLLINGHAERLTQPGTFSFPSLYASDVPELLSNEITSLRNVPMKPNHTAMPQRLFITDFSLPTHWRVPVQNVHAKLLGLRNMINH